MLAIFANLDALKSRFRRALADAGATHPSDAVFEELVSRYAEPHRRYHTLAHLDACLVWLDWFSASARHPAEVELALWFHDAIYDPRAGDNERRSAHLARERLAAVGVPGPAIERVVAHVLATEHHTAAGGDAALVIDLDLTILGAAARDYDRFEEMIRCEYAHVGAREFALGRRSVLEKFLARDEIYVVPKVRDELEIRARANLGRRIAELSRESI